jgi:hypothetical protein
MSAVPTRRSAGLGLAALVAVIGVAHTVLRDDRWAYEWRWASFQYQLATLLVAPVVAAVASWEGVSLRRSGDPVIAAGRVMSFSALAIARLVGWIVVGYVAGSLAVLVQVLRARGLGVPPWEATVMFAPALAQLAAVVVTSFWLGWSARHAMVVPVVAVGWFAVLVGANVLLPDDVARVGGATSSLLGLQVPTRTQAFQAAVAGAFVAATVLARWWVDRQGTEVGRRVMGAVLSGLVAIWVLHALHVPSDGFFRLVPVTEVCERSEPSVCVATDYRPVLPRLHEQLEPVLVEVRALGVAPPEELHQDPSVDPVLADLIHGGEAHAPHAVVNAWSSIDCPALWDADSLVNESRYAWTRYLTERLASERPRAEGAEADDLRARAGWIRTCTEG